MLIIYSLEEKKYVNCVFINITRCDGKFSDASSSSCAGFKNLYNLNNVYGNNFLFNVILLTMCDLS